ncbi:MAG: glycosyltransferase family 4 protein [Deltaproteobacteria bacterium]|nr:MAG: glycosyltransferase family 4 protein [Deltaproteobacteria bacterium]
MEQASGQLARRVAEAARAGEAPAGSGMNPRLLFAAYMAGGNATILKNLEDQISGRPDVSSAWLGVEMDAESKRLDRRPRRSLLPGTIRNSLLTGWEIGKLERQGGRFDAAWFFQQTICMFLWRFRSRVPYVVAMDGTPPWYARNGLWYTVHRFDPRSLSARLKQELTRRVYAKAFHLLPLSWSCRQSLIDDYGIEPDRITVVPPGIDLATYVAPDRQGRSEAGRRLQLLFIGADFTRKGGDLLVKLAQEPAFEDVQFNFVTHAYKGPAAKNIRVFEGITTNSPQMVALLREADVTEVVQEGETGYLVPRDDLAALADRIRRLRADRGLRLRMGAAGRRRVEAHFNAQTIARTVVDLLKRAAASRSQQPR